MKKAAGAGSEEEEEICSKKVNQWRCKNASADNELGYCQKHFEKIKNLPPDEHRCPQTSVKGIKSYRCNNFRMGYGADDDDTVPKRRYCEKHYNYSTKSYQNLKAKNRSGVGEKTCGSAYVGTKRKLPPDEERCSLRSSGGWRCKNFRMSHGAAADDSIAPKSKYCQKHYHYFAKYKNLKEKKKSGNGEGDLLLDDTSEEKIPAKRKKIETTSGELKSSTRNSEFESLDQVSVELKLAEKELEIAKMNLELEKTTAATTDEDATEYWRNKCSDLETLVLALEIEYLTMIYEGSSTMRCLELGNSEKNDREADIKGSSANAGTKSKEIERTEWSRELDFTDFLIDKASLSTSNKRKKKKEMEKTMLPPDGHRCGMTGGGGWRCKNFRMGHGAAIDDDTVPKTRFCEKHYNLNAKYNENHKKKLEQENHEHRCCQKTGSGGWRCKNFRMGHGPDVEDVTVPKTRYCEEHYNLHHEKLKKKALEEYDEHRCGHTGGGGWRCKNFRIGDGAAAADHTVPKTIYCEKHYNFRAKYYKKLKKEEEEREKNKLLPPDEHRCCKHSSKWRCKNFRMGYGDDDTVPKSRYCEKHFNHNTEYNAMYYQNRRKWEEEKMEKNKLLPPDEQRCCQHCPKWRCKNFRMGYGDDDTVPKSRYCEKHFNYNVEYNAMYYQKRLKKRSGDREAAAAGCSATGPIECRGSKQRRKVTKEDDVTPTTWDREGFGPIECTGLRWRRKNVTEEDFRSLLMQPATSDDTSVTIVQGGSDNVKRKRENVERAEDDRFIDDTLGESECSDSYVDSENSVGDLMDMLGMENWNWNNEEMKWNSEADMLSCFEDDPVLSYL